MFATFDYQDESTSKFTAGYDRWLVLIYYERKLLLAGWCLVAGAGLV